MSGNGLVRRYTESFNTKDAAAYAALFADGGVIHDAVFPEPIKGRTAVQQVIEGILRAFPDMTWEQVGSVVDGGDRVAFVIAVEGTHDGPLVMPDGELPATGRKVSYEAAVFWTVDSDGLITEERSYYDATGVAAQIGLTG